MMRNHVNTIKHTYILPCSAQGHPNLYMCAMLSRTKRTQRACVPHAKPPSALLPALFLGPTRYAAANHKVWILQIALHKHGMPIYGTVNPAYVQNEHVTAPRSLVIVALRKNPARWNRSLFSLQSLPHKKKSAVEHPSSSSAMVFSCLD